MPWKETCPMDERESFINDWLKHERSVTTLCSAYGISRKTGYKWIERFRARGLEGLLELSRAPKTSPQATPPSIVTELIGMRRRYPYWGPRKLVHRLRTVRPDTPWPAPSTVGEILKARGMVAPRRRRRRTPLYDGPLCGKLNPNDVWTADFKGWFRTLDGSRVDPFTLCDGASRYLLRCNVVTRTDGPNVRAQLTSAFREFGLPRAIRTDNGAPFASVGPGGLSKTAIWLIRLGIQPERIRAGHPEENGAHERMHKTLKQQTAKPPERTPLQQQEAFDQFRYEYNNIRPHETLGMRTPAEAYAPSSRTLQKKLPPIEYPAGTELRKVAQNGLITLETQQFSVGRALAEETVAVQEIGEGAWAIRFATLELGTYDLRSREFKPGKVLPMSPV